MAKTGKSPRVTRKQANALLRAGDLVEAQKAYASICRNDARDTDSWLKLSSLSRKLGLYGDAGYCARHVLSMQPSNPTALLEYGTALQHQGNTDQAIECYRRSLALNPSDGQAHYLLATACLERGLVEPAISHYRKTIEASPGHIEALNNLSALLTEQGKIQEALALLTQALKLKPDAYHMLINQARAYLFSGDAPCALEILDKVVRLHPDNLEARSKYLLCLNYIQQPDPHRIYREHVRWESTCNDIYEHFQAHDNVVENDRKLRIAYVSPDLKSHSVASFIEPLLAEHDRRRFHVTCYADIANPDDVSRRLQSMSDAWHLTRGLSDEQLCERIRADRIDILVDLAGHTANNRLALFFRKPAPVEVSYLGYPNTTGLSSIDYRLTDAIADPPGVADEFHTESLVRLPDGFLCYQPPENSPAISAPPGHDSGSIVFGSFNNLAKLTPEVIETWARILGATDSSRLLLKSKATSDPYTLNRLIDLFAKQGVERDRLIILPPRQGKKEHLDAYNSIDIALDTFPYNGTTTTCEALWMGIPVVTLCGNVHASRVGASLLSRLSLSELAAHNPDEYIQIAETLSKRPDLLAQLRRDLRPRMQRSALCDAPLFARHIEAAYLEMWHRYCDARQK